MPTSKKDDTPHPDPSSGPEPYAFLIGQLKTATENTSRGIEILSRESRVQSEALIKAVTSLESVTRQVGELVTLVRDGETSLVNQVRTNRGEMTDLRQDHTALSGRVATLETARVESQNRWSWLVGGRVAILWVLGAIAWAVTTAISLYAAVGQWLGGKGSP